MKFFITAFIVILSASAAVAQNKPQPMPALNGQPIREMTTAEANALNGTAQPTIGGIPYAQYKAQQDALKPKPAAAPQQLGATAPAAKPAEVLGAVTTDSKNHP